MMNPLNHGCGLWHLPPEAACAFRPVMAGRLVSYDGCRYRLGHYTCWHIVRKGTGMVRCGRHSAPIGPGDMFSIIESRTIEYFDDPADPWEFYYLHLEGPAAAEMTRNAGFDDRKPWQRPRHPETVLQGFRHLYALAQKAREEDSVKFHIEVLRLYDLLARKQGRFQRSYAELVRQAGRLAADPGFHRANVDEMARALQVDRSTLHRAFREAAGVAPGDYLRRRRIDHAARLLREQPGMALEDAARASGFDNVKYFTRAFKRATGVTPGRFRAAPAAGPPAAGNPPADPVTG